MQNFLPTTNTTPGYLAPNYLTPGQWPGYDEVRNDKAVAFAICPVQQNIAGQPNPFLVDYETGDAFSMALGNFDEPPTQGTTSLQVGAQTGGGLATISATITAAALETILNVALAAESEALCAVVSPQSGSFIITAVSNGAITDGFFSVVSSSLLYPISTAFFTKESNGSGSSPYRYAFTMRQAPFCFAEPTVELTAADVSVEDTQDTGVGQSVIRRVFFTVSEVSAGSFTLNATANAVTATCGTVTPLMSAREFGLVLGQHPEINYSTPDANDNVSVTISGQSWVVTAIGDLFDDATFELDAINSVDNPLQGPAGLSGSINYNTFGLYAYSLSQQGSTFTVTRQIQRTRGGETRTLYSGEVTVYKELIDAATLVPTPLPSYYTAVQSDSRFARRDGDSAVLIGVITGANIAQEGRLLPITNGFKIQASTDGSTWQDAMSIVAS